MTDDEIAATHKIFQDRIKKSVTAVEIAGIWFEKMGYKVDIPETRISPQRSSWKQYRDQGDLFITIQDAEGKEYRTRVEVKHLGVEFSGPDDWPFGGEFFVCSKYSFDNAIPKPCAYYVFSKDYGCVGIAYVAATKAWWAVKKMVDRKLNNYRQDVYACPTGLVVWKHGLTLLP